MYKDLSGDAPEYMSVTKTPSLCARAEETATFKTLDTAQGNPKQPLHLSSLPSHCNSCAFSLHPVTSAVFLL